MYIKFNELWSVSLHQNFFCFRFVNTLVYYGLSLNTKHLGGDIYKNFFLSSLMEVPAYLTSVCLINWWGVLKLILNNIIYSCRCFCWFFLVPEIWRKSNWREVFTGAKSPNQSELILIFLTMGWLGVSLLSPGWDVSPSQGYPSAFHQASLTNCPSTHLYSWV